MSDYRKEVRGFTKVSVQEFSQKKINELLKKEATTIFEHRLWVGSQFMHNA